MANRRRFTEALDECIANSKKTAAPISLIMMDIDHFKKINDTFGHATGDKVLKAVCQRMEANVRPQDVVGRLGGEEFAVLLPETDADIGQIVAERLRRALEISPIHCDQGAIRFTASFGGVSVAPGAELPEADELLSVADKCLYSSKEGGRNRVTWGI